ncbi:hypothetical protein [Tabrizicola sp.]|uniref:hypothetical protein n=1 Tax=Tabrizicola sp. TaxID=2005166 RepID=UPI0027347074|nr:hypothetical protein [Tabrizicola sp.]MDP3194900.1 hypothetical protein [Tabrizicola sp.]
MRTALLLALLAAAPAHAACQGDEAFSCQIGTKTLEVCYWKGMLTYAYGPQGKPELFLNERLETVDFTPWPGIGSSMWETVVFQNDGYTYEVWTSVERDPEATEPRSGGVRVLKGDAIVAELSCNRGTATPMDGLNDLKAGIGQCWDMDSRTWGLCN